jgi:hypothetical protein
LRIGLSLFVLAGLCSRADAQIAYQFSYFQSLDNGAFSKSSAGLVSYGTSQFADTSTITGGVTSGNQTQLRYAIVGTLSVNVPGTVPDVGNHCQALGGVSITAGQPMRYLYSFTYSGSPSIPELDTGFLLTQGSSTLASGNGPGPSIIGTGIVDLSDGSALQLQSRNAANFTATASGSFATEMSVQTLLASAVPIGGQQPTSGNAIWNQPISGDWSNQTSWMQNVLPASGIDVFLNTSSSKAYSVNLGTNSAAKSLILQGDTVTLATHGNTVTAGFLTVDGFGNRTGSLVLGGAGTLSAPTVQVTPTGNLAINDATLLASSSFGGITVSSGGTLSVSSNGHVTTSGLSIGTSSLFGVTVGDGSSVTVTPRFPSVSAIANNGVI